MAETSMSLDDMICLDLYKARLAVGRAYKPLLAPLGLTYAQYLVLVALWQQDGQSIGALGRALALETSTLTPLLKRMEQAGLVQRRRDAADERRVLITLSAKGQALQDQQPAITRAMSTRLGLDRAELDQMRGALQKLQRKLGPL